MSATNRYFRFRKFKKRFKAETRVKEACMNKFASELTNWNIKLTVDLD